MKSNLFYKVFGTYLAITVLAVVIVWFQAEKQIKTRIMNKTESDLAVYAQVADVLSAKLYLAPKALQLSETTGARVTVIDAGGEVLADTETVAPEMDNHLNRPEIQEARVKGKGSSVRYSQTLGIDTLYVAFPLLNEKGVIDGYIRFARPLLEIRSAMVELNRLLLEAFLIIGVISFIIAFIFTSRLVTPIQEMEHFTRNLRDGEISGTLLIDSNDEVGRLARNINYIVMELQEQVHLANEEKGKLEAAFTSMSDGVLILDHLDRIEASNAAFKTIFGVRHGNEIAGKTSLEAFRNIELQNALDRFKKTGMPVSQEIDLSGENGVILEINIASIHGLPKGEEKSMIVFHDVSRLKQLERMRADFVANVTHEIKTPLTAILGFIETLREGALDDRETADRFLATIQRQAQRLNLLVNDLLTLSNIEMGNIQLFFEPVALSGVVENVMPIIEPKAQARNLVIDRAVSEELPAIRADRDRLVQIILNIADNAVKFTTEGGRVSLRAFDNKQGQVILEIEDTGIGVPKDEIPRLGERFYRVDKARSREMGGTGLGLSIVKHLMRVHKGSMKINSRLGKGTTVSLTFPVCRQNSSDNCSPRVTSKG